MKDKRIKCFFDVGGTFNIENFGEEVQKQFCESVKKLEDTYRAKCDITLVTLGDDAESRLNKSAKVFAKNDLHGRVTSSLDPKKYWSQEDQYGVDYKSGDFPQNSGRGKGSFVAMFGKKHEKNPEDILFIMFAGNEAGDEWMFKTQGYDPDGHFPNGGIPAYPKSIPSVYISTADNWGAKHNNTVSAGIELAHNGEQKADIRFWDDMSNVVALKEGIDELSTGNTKYIMMNALKQKTVTRYKDLKPASKSPAIKPYKMEGLNLKDLL